MKNAYSWFTHTHSHTHLHRHQSKWERASKSEKCTASITNATFGYINIIWPTFAYVIYSIFHYSNSIFRLFYFSHSLQSCYSISHRNNCKWKLLSMSHRNKFRRIRPSTGSRANVWIMYDIAIWWLYAHPSVRAHSICWEQNKCECNVTDERSKAQGARKRGGGRWGRPGSEWIVYKLTNK